MCCVDVTTKSNAKRGLDYVEMRLDVTQVDLDLEVATVQGRSQWGS